jgi:hypothetical protein
MMLDELDIELIEDIANIAGVSRDFGGERVGAALGFFERIALDDEVDVVGGPEFAGETVVVSHLLVVGGEQIEAACVGLEPGGEERARDAEGRRQDKHDAGPSAREMGDESKYCMPHLEFPIDKGTGLQKG